MMKDNYFYEVHFYLAFIIQDKYLKNKALLLDNYAKAIECIYNDYIKYDMTTMSLMNSIENYLNEHDDFIKKVLLDCEVYNL